MVKLKREKQPWEGLGQEGSKYKDEKGKDPKAETMSEEEKYQGACVAGGWWERWHRIRDEIGKMGRAMIVYRHIQDIDFNFFYCIEI